MNTPSKTFEDLKKEQAQLRQQLIIYITKHPVQITEIAPKIGLCYAHVQRFLRNSEYRIGRVALCKIKNFLNTHNQ